MGAEKTIVTQRPIVQLEMVDGQPERFGFSCQQIYDWFLSRDFVITLSDGTDVGTKWQHYTKKMERFFVHKSLLQDEYLKEVAVKQTKTIPSAEEKKLKEPEKPIVTMPI